MGSEMARRLAGEGGRVCRLDAVVVVVVVAALGFNGVVSGAEAARESGEVARGVDVACTRPPLSFLLTLPALTVALWGSGKHDVLRGKSGLLVGMIVGVFLPLVDVNTNVANSCTCVAVLSKYHAFPHPDGSCGDGVEQASEKSPSLSSLSPFSKPPLRILATSSVVVHALNGSELLTNELIRVDEEPDIDESEAMVMGEVADGRTEEGDYVRKEPHRYGILALELAGVLPKHDELKFLRGNSGFAMVAVFVQAIGYIYAVVYRSATDSAVAPLEVVGLVFNIYLLIEASLFSARDPCHRPLVVYMNSGKNDRLVEFLSENDQQHFMIPDVHKTTMTILFAVIICSNIVPVRHIVGIKRSANITVAVPLIIFSASSFFEYILHFIVYFTGRYTFPISTAVLSHPVMLLNAALYVWAAMVTGLCWKSEHFNTRAESIHLSQLIPFRGW